MTNRLASSGEAIVPVAWCLLTQWQERHRPRGRGTMSDPPGDDA